MVSSNEESAMAKIEAAVCKLRDLCIEHDKAILIGICLGEFVDAAGNDVVRTRVVSWRDETSVTCPEWELASRLLTENGQWVDVEDEKGGV